MALNDQRADRAGPDRRDQRERYEAALPDDGGHRGGAPSRSDIERFSATSSRWTAAPNSPTTRHVKVQRLEDGEWRDYADQSGEIPVTIEYPQGEDVPELPAGRPGVALDRALRGVRLQVRDDRGSPRHAGGDLPLRRRRAASPGPASDPYHLEVGGTSRCARGTASRWRTRRGRRRARGISRRARGTP